MSLVLAETGRRELRAERLHCVGVGTGSGNNGVGEAPDIGEGRVTQKTMEKIGDGHLPREEVGTDELGQNVE